MNLEALEKFFVKNGCKQAYVKRLAPNDNSKNQVYIADNFEFLNVFPISEIKTDKTGKRKIETFKAQVPFGWITEDFTIEKAPHSQFILYPDYPEIRFSGFLLGCNNAPSALMTSREPGRLLFLGVTDEKKIIGYVVSSNSHLASEYENLQLKLNYGLFELWSFEDEEVNKQKLLSELNRIYNLGWISSKRLDKAGVIMDCNAPQCGGYTLEAELGIIPNGYSEPDYLGWEIKQFGVKNFERILSQRVTLMTPEPTDGFYKVNGAEAFVRKYGYKDKKGRPDRLNFGGTHFVGIKHKSTNLKLDLLGFDPTTNKITDPNGCIALLDENAKIVAGWSFASLIKHWNGKHNKACYVPSLSKKEDKREYRYGNKILLGERTDFYLFLKEMSAGNIYYDPGIKIENASGKSHVKARSQFRIKSSAIASIYHSREYVDLISV